MDHSSHAINYLLAVAILFSLGDITVNSLTCTANYKFPAIPNMEFNNGCKPNQKLDWFDNCDLMCAWGYTPDKQTWRSSQILVGTCYKPPLNCQPLPCPANSFETINTGGRVCTCKVGYANEPFNVFNYLPFLYGNQVLGSCQAIPCPPGSIATSTPTGLSCSCKPGFQGGVFLDSFKTSYLGFCFDPKGPARATNSGSKAPLPACTDKAVCNPANIALNKTAVQSTFLPKELLNFYSAALAVDGNTNPNFEGKSCTLSIMDKPWWSIDLGKEYNVAKVVVYSSNSTTSPTYGRLRNVEVRVGKKPVTASGPSPKNDICTYQKKALADGTSEVLQCSKPILGRYVTIQLMAKNATLSLCEVAVFE